MPFPNHTLGPWLFEAGVIVTDGAPHGDRPTVIAQLISARHAGTFTEPGECEANGQLMAAAPKLAELLSRVLQHHLADEYPAFAVEIETALQAAGVLP